MKPEFYVQPFLFGLVPDGLSEDDRAIVDAVLARERTRLRLATRARHKDEKRWQHQRHREHATLQSPITFDRFFMALPDPGALTLNPDAVARAIVTFRLQRHPQPRARWKDEMRLRRLYEREFQRVPEIMELLVRMIETWLYDVLDPWPPDEVLQRLEALARDPRTRPHARAMMALPSVTTFLAGVHTGQIHLSETDRKRLKQTLRQIYAGKSGAPRVALRDGAELWQQYRGLLGDLSELKRQHRVSGGDARTATSIVHSLRLIAKRLGLSKRANYWFGLLKKQTPSRVAKWMLADTRDVGFSSIDKALRRT